MTDPGQMFPSQLDAVSWPLRTARLTIRRAALSDEDATWTYRSLETVSRWTGHYPHGRSVWHSLLAHRLPSALIVERDGHVIGDLLVKVEDGWAQREVRDHARGVQAELGWVLDPAATGNGYATEAVRELLRLCFEDLGLRRVTANVFADNEASCRLAERVGMRRELYAVRGLLHRDWGWVDGVGYAVLSEEWTARH